MLKHHWVGATSLAVNTVAWHMHHLYLQWSTGHWPPSSVRAELHQTLTTIICTCSAPPNIEYQASQQHRTPTASDTWYAGAQGDYCNDSYGIVKSSHTAQLAGNIANKRRDAAYRQYRHHEARPAALPVCCLGNTCIGNVPVLHLFNSRLQHWLKSEKWAAVKLKRKQVLNKQVNFFKKWTAKSCWKNGEITRLAWTAHICYDYCKHGENLVTLESKTRKVYEKCLRLQSYVTVNVLSGFDERSFF